MLTQISKPKRGCKGEKEFFSLSAQLTSCGRKGKIKGKPSGLPFKERRPSTDVYLPLYPAEAEATVSIFGRATPVELEYWQVEKL